ncbi:transposase [Scytonema sp. UIC 10036]|uniref:Rpn family recombination-promoting nuclease/putative transposase n=1 Tax=Scytonema sp. UIC 10036 TaxID=2304196 RepID=UPI0012DAC797|nr:Rpn family recombination-promoting nuclease/putative transposase [Scytonema sp. UIC 10036]MUG95933.1 transposase [Scytonema sp. UIC 10036]
MTESETNVPANYDESWKAAIEQYFEAFVAFFFPEAHAAIAWEKGYDFLDKEFQQIVRDAEVGTRFVDKLLKVWLRDGEEAWLLLHVELQSQRDKEFAKRMFTYNYRIYDRYGQEVISLAVLGDEQPQWRPTEYGYGRWGCDMRLRFPIVKLLDYTWETLESSDNPFAVVVMAHRKTQETTQSSPERLQWKLRLIKGLYQRGYSRQDILEIFRILDRMMRLPETLELSLRNELKRFEEENQMPYITSIERIGRLEERQDIIRNLLVSRFGTIDEQLEAIVKPLTELPTSEFSSLLLSLSTLSREELLTRFA